MTRDQAMTPLIIGFSVNGWNVARALHQLPVAPLVLDDDPSSIFWKAKKVQLVRAPALRGEALLECLRSAVRGEENYVLISATEEAVRTLSERRSEVPANVQLLFPEHDTVDLLLDKRRFYARAVELGHRISRMHFLQSWEAAEARQVRFPCIVKGRVKLYVPGVAKAYRVDHAAGLRSVLDTLSRAPGLKPEDVVIQEWVPGGDDRVLFCMQYYDRSGQLRASFVGRKIRQWRPQIGGTASAEPYQDAEALEQTTRFFQAVGMRGICSMEFKRSLQDGQLYMIEPTACRADYQEGVAVANGCNIPLLAYLDAAGIAYSPNGQAPARPVKWLHAGDDYAAAAQYMARGELSWRQWLGSLRGPKSYAIYTPQDPGPFLELLKRKAKNRMARLNPWS